ncbi:hypothetical protein [Amycolatopsis sp. lyj-90]|uniref:hypothetical protein n=1 Tax=Amycolatopsis sp. lyj-90 TaxID=2789285 RepID=UPI00397B1F29
MTSSAPQSAGDFVAERRGPHLLIKRSGEAESFAWPPPVPGELFVAVSAGAARESSLATLLPALLHRNIVGRADVQAVRVALAGLGADVFVSQALADALDVGIFAPSGDFSARPGAALYASGGWRRFRPGAPSSPGGHRHPAPGWEALLPVAPIAVDGVVIEPIPAGISVRDVHARPVVPGDLAFSVQVDPDVAKVVVSADGQVPDPSVVAALMPRVPLQLVVPPSQARTHAWLREMARVLARDIGVVTAPFAGSFPPFATLLRQCADGSQQVVESVSPPRGWQRRDRAGYRMGNVLADVVPSGLALRTGPSDPASAESPFDPDGWTLHLGTPGEPLGAELLTAAEAVLEELTPDLRGTARLRLAGKLDDRSRELLSTTPTVRPDTGAVSSDRGMPAITPVGRPPAMVTPPVALVSGPPVPTVSSAPEPSSMKRDVARPLDDVARSMPSAATPPTGMAAGPGRAVDVPETAGRPSEGPADGGGEPTTTHQSRETLPPPPAADPAGIPRPADAAPGATQPPRLELPSAGTSPVRTLKVTDRPSTAAEQSRFTAAAGEAYGEALATVNAALATWPSMRQQEAEAKADYVAVCLYLGSGRGSSSELDAAVRDGHDGGLDGQVPCLVSGLRRLPIHRRAVLRQGKADHTLEGTAEPGALLTEPGFLVGSTDLDVTVPGAELDVLIWPASARRTAELRIGQPVSEVVFFAGARFKALAVRPAEPADEQEEDGPIVPRTAALFRELAPGEQPSPSGELDELDLNALAKLDQALERRRRGALRVVDEPGAVNRMTTTLVEWRAQASSPVAVERSATLAS